MYLLVSSVSPFPPRPILSNFLGFSKFFFFSINQQKKKKISGREKVSHDRTVQKNDLKIKCKYRLTLILAVFYLIYQCVIYLIYRKIPKNTNV